MRVRSLASFQKFRSLKKFGKFRLILLAFLLVVGLSVATSAATQGSDNDDRVSSASANGGEHTVTLKNETDGKIWVGAGVNADGSAELTGLPTLDPGKSATVTIPENSGAGHWRGKFFARQGCEGESGSTFHCAVADCGPFADRCSTGEQPASLAEFNFDRADGMAPWYNVSYVNAVSAPITIVPDGVPPPENGGECAAVGCPTDLLSACPPENLTKDAAGKPIVCVNPNRDAKTAYSNALTEKCPSAYSWSKHDAEAGNEVVRQCRECTGMTVTFHGTGGGAPAPGGDQPAGDNGPQNAVPRPDKAPVDGAGKGVGLNPVDGASEALAASGAKWYHNWASSSAGVTTPEGVEFVPSIWGPNSVTEQELGNAAREGKHLLGFNEPDRADQANMSPEQALDLWPQLEKTGLKLGAPAVSVDADKPGGWLDRFMQGAQARGLRVDFIPLHWYGGDFTPAATGQFIDYLERVHQRYNKPIWVTEYALIDFSQGTPRYPNEFAQADFLKRSQQAMSDLGYVERSAWFALNTETSPTGLFYRGSPNASGNAFREVK